MAGKEETRRQIAELINKFERERNRQQSEADVRADYIDLLFQALGWNVYNDPGQVTNYRREGYVRGAGYVDVGLEIRGQPVLFLEAKRFGLIPRSSERTGDRSLEEKQAFRYARGKKITYAILTNFERLHLFNADHERLVHAFDIPQQYLDNFEELWRLSPLEVERGSLPWWEGQLQKRDVDLEFLASLRRWRLQLAKAIHEHNRGKLILQRDGVFDFDRLMEAVQRILDRLILVRYGDDREVLLAHDLLENMLTEYQRRGAYARPDHLMRAFIDLSQMMDEHHNTTLFAPGHICEQITLPNDPFAQVIDEMNRISFRKFTSDILGNTYESYLGTKLTLRNGQVEDEERRDIRKGRGIYYTPRWVVKYIVDNTLGKRLTELEAEHGLQAIEKVRGLSVLDPACGSGSFLIYAYHVLADFYRRMNHAITEAQTRLLAEAAQFRLFETLEEIQHLPQTISDYPQVILKEHLFGVDLDLEAAEIAAVNLTMQAFADSRQKKLPLILNENIKVGNSLISGGEEELKPYFGDAWRDKHPFNWEQEFPHIMGRGGFDVVIGNPPYIDSEWMTRTDPTLRTYCNTRYSSAQGNWDVFCIFVEKSLSLCRKSGLSSMIVPNKLLAADFASALRRFLAQSHRVLVLRDYSRVPVFPSGVYPIVYVAEAKNPTTTGFLQIEQMAISNGSVDVADKGQIPWKEIVDLKGEPWSGVIGHGQGGLLEKIRQGSVSVGDIAFVIGAATVSEAYEYKSLIVEYDAGLKQYLGFVNTGTIDRYSIQWGIRPTRYLNSTFRQPVIPQSAWPNLPKKRLAQARSSKIIIAGMTKGLECAYDEGTFLAGKSTSIVLSDSLDLRYLLGLLNSKLMTYYFSKQFEGLRLQGGFLRVGPPQVRQLPVHVPEPSDRVHHDRLVALVERMLELHKSAFGGDKSLPHSEQEDIAREIARTDSEIDALVYDLYGLTAEEIQIVEEAAGETRRGMREL